MSGMKIIYHKDNNGVALIYCTVIVLQKFDNI
jgi:hypothetical protein